MVEKVQPKPLPAWNGNSSKKLFGGASPFALAIKAPVVVSSAPGAGTPNHTKSSSGAPSSAASPSSGPEAASTDQMAIKAPPTISRKRFVVPWWCLSALSRCDVVAAVVLRKCCVRLPKICQLNLCCPLFPRRLPACLLMS
jgi:hypothetical protein